jgi:hypothetical protein
MDANTFRNVVPFCDRTAVRRVFREIVIEMTTIYSTNDRNLSKNRILIVFVGYLSLPILPGEGNATAGSSGTVR